LSPHGRPHDDERTEEVTEGDALQDSGDANSGELEVGKTVQEQTEGEEDERAAHDMPPDRPSGITASQAPSQEQEGSPTA